MTVSASQPARFAKTAEVPKPRRIAFRFDDTTSRSKYFIDDDMVFSHYVASLSAGFPSGEESFIRSVRRFADQISDPVLKKRAAGFIGQEAMHGQEHRRLNERLAELGYPIHWFESEASKNRLIKLENWLPAKVHLAITAAAEHATAVLAERVLSKDEIQQIPGDPEVWHLLNWHALEELEHKSVAFDVYQAVRGPEATRIAVMLVALGMFPTITLTSLGLALAVDPIARRHPLRVTRQAYRLFRGPFFNGLLFDLAKYLRPGFHPSDIDTDELLHRWQRELFGADGELIDHLK